MSDLIERRAAIEEDILIIGKPYRLAGLEVILFKDAYGNDWITIRRHDDFIEKQHIVERI